MKAIILAAGYATRLYPLTLNKPKPLLPIAGRPMLNHILDKVVALKTVEHVYIVTNAKFYNAFVKWSKTYRSNTPITVLNDKTVSNDDRLGALGDIAFVLEHEQPDDDLLVVAGDNLFAFDIRKQYALFEKRRASVVAVRDLKDKSLLAKRFGTVVLDKDKKIVDFEEKPLHPKSTLAATACYLLKKADVQLLEQCMQEHNKPDNMGDFISYLISRKPVYGFVFDEGWFDIGTPEQLREADAWVHK